MHELRNWWDRWGPYLMIAVVAIGFLRVVWGRQPFCGPETEHCFREWVSALGGWAALAAAVPTVLFLSKQVSAADRHHKASAAIELRKTTALARTILEDAAMLDFVADLNRPSSAWPSNKAEFESVMKTFDEYLVDRFAQFEAELGPPRKDRTFVSLRTKAGMIRRLVHERDFELVRARKMLTDLSDDADSYASAVTTMALSFIDDPAEFWESYRR